MYRSNNMEKPGIIDSRFSGIRELCFSVYRVLCQSRQRRVVLLRTANRAMPAAASNAMATPYGAMAAPVSAELVGKEPGADPDNLTNREKTIPVKKAGEEPHVNAESLLAEVGIARSTYHCRFGTKIRRC